MIDEVRLALAALRARGVPRDQGLDVLPMPSVPGALIGLDHAARPHLLLELPVTDETTTGLPGDDLVVLDVRLTPLVVGAVPGTFLDTACLAESLAEVFEHFIAAVLTRLTESNDHAVGALNHVLERWRRFLVAAGSPPDRRKLASILGELLVVRDLVRREPTRAIAAWVGPFGGRHDFRRSRTALEVKTTLAHTSRKVTIHGEDQLSEPEDGRLFLHLVRLEQVASSGESVASLADDLLSMGAPVDGVFDALASAGIALADLASTDDVRFDVRERLTVPVDSETPRIVPGSFVGGERPLGIIDLNYVIDLDHMLPRALPKSEYDVLLDDLATGGG